MKVEMYYMDGCPYCHRALRLLEDKGVTVTIYNVTKDPALWQESKQRSNRDTVPQVFINDQHIGGCDDTLALEAQGKLETLLAQ